MLGSAPAFLLHPRPHPKNETDKSFERKAESSQRIQNAAKEYNMLQKNEKTTEIFGANAQKTSRDALTFIASGGIIGVSIIIGAWRNK